MTCPDLARIQSLIEIGNLAMRMDEAERLAELERADLRAAYEGYKSRIGQAHVERDTPEWEAMLAETAGAYAAAQRAKRKAYAAKRRLRAAIARLEADRRGWQCG